MGERMSNHNFSVDPEKSSVYLKKTNRNIAIWRDNHYAYYSGPRDEAWVINRDARNYDFTLYSAGERQRGIILQEVSEAGSVLDVGSGMAKAIIGLSLHDPNVCFAGVDDDYHFDRDLGTNPNGGNIIIPNEPGVQLVNCDWGELHKIAAPESIGLFWFVYSALRHCNSKREIQNVIDGVDHIAKPGAILRGNYGNIGFDGCIDAEEERCMAITSILKTKGWRVRPIETTRSIRDRTMPPMRVIFAQKPRRVTHE